ncbi:MAG TPA: Calx-beta domain-containing protein [Actinomycetota bacterium]|nr:Calx-beta domain-containing protein [Actinomycetota bacterium]
MEFRARGSDRRDGIATVRRLALALAVLGTLVVGLPAPATGAPTPSITIGDVTIPEGDVGSANATFTIQASPPPKPTAPLQVSWATAAGTAAAPADFTTSSGSVSLTKNAPTRTVTVPVLGDLLDEADETFVVNLSSLVGSPGKIADGQSVATITDDDALPVVSVNDASVVEGNVGTATATFTISLSSASGRPVSVSWATTAGTATAGTDHVAASGSRTIPAGSTTATVGVVVTGDTLDEDDETFGMALSAPSNATLGDAAGVATITDDDDVPTLSIAEAAAAEGNAGTQTYSFVASLSAASGRTVTVQWTTQDDTAVAGSDYTSASGILTFAPGDTSETATVTVHGDVVAELDETFAVVLTAPTNAALGDDRTFGSILDDEGLPVLDLGAPAVAEGDAGLTSLAFTVSLSNPSALPVTVDWTTADGTALAGSDYAAASGVVSFAPLDVSETVVVDVLGDAVYERDETVAVELSNATNAPIGRTRRLGSIGNDDAAPVASIADGSIPEGGAGSTATLSLVVSLSAASEVDATVTYATTDGTAVADGDYAAATGSVTVPAGATSATIPIVVRGDTTYEVAETFSVDLSGPVDATVDDGAATATIVNDDPVPTTITISVSPGRRTVAGAGILEATTAGHRVSVTLYRLSGGRSVRIAAKTVAVKRLRDRDGDGKTDGKYTASFARPAAGGTYKLVARFRGSPTYEPCTRSKRFRLGAG